MKLGDFELKITGGEEIEGGYVLLSNGQQYKVYLGNHGTRPCDVEVTIDGLGCGIFRVGVNQAAEIDRPAHDSGRFTFFEIATAEGGKAGIKANDTLGLVTAVYKPEYERVTLFSSPTVLFQESEIPAAGGTGLTGKSDQQFTNVPILKHTASSEWVTINLRLAGRRHPAIRPLSGVELSTPVPPPLT